MEVIPRSYGLPLPIFMRTRLIHPKRSFVPRHSVISPHDDTLSFCTYGLLHCMCIGTNFLHGLSTQKWYFQPLRYPILQGTPSSILSNLVSKKSKNTDLQFSDGSIFFLTAKAKSPPIKKYFYCSLITCMADSNAWRSKIGMDWSLATHLSDFLFIRSRSRKVLPRYR